VQIIEKYLEFASTGTIERSCVYIDQKNGEHANREPGKNDGNQDYCPKDGGESARKYPEGLWSAEGH